MGILFSRPPEEGVATAPWIRTPFSDMTGALGHWDDGPCLPFQLRWVDCVQAYGPHKGKEKCKILYQDFCECAGSWKQLQRTQDMKEERNRQWIKGVLGRGPRVALFDEPPPKDSYGPECMDDFSNNV